MSESGGISENLDAGLRKEDSQEDGSRYPHNLTLLCLLMVIPTL